MCFLSLSCHEPSLVQPTTKMDPSQKFPGWTRKILSRPSGLEPAPRSNGSQGLFFLFLDNCFSNGRCNTPGQDSAGLLIQEPSRISLYAVLRPHLRMLVSITPSVQTAINRFCPGSVDFSFRTISVLFALGIPRSKWISQMLVFSTTPEGPLHAHGQAGEIFPGVRGGYWKPLLSVEAYQQFEALAAWSGGGSSDTAI